MANRIAVYPASLDPIHNGHIDVAVRAAKLFDQIIVAVYNLPKKKAALLRRRTDGIGGSCLQGL